MYNYLENVTSDVLDAIRGNYSAEEIAEKLYEDRDGFSSQLNDDLWIDDSVTGNASGSYTFSSYEAAENLAGNYDLVQELVSEFGIDAETVADRIDDPEYWDVSIRCYLLYQAIDAALDELEEDEEIQAIMEKLEEAESLEDAEERKIA